MTDPDRRGADPVDPTKLRAGLIDGLRASRATEREVFDALDPATRDDPAADGGWSAKAVLAHLSAWRQRMSDVLASTREGREAPSAADLPVDEINANFHAERAGWTWGQAVADAETTAERLVAEISAASDEVLTDPKFVGSIMGDGPEHALGTSR